MKKTHLCSEYKLFAEGNQRESGGKRGKGGWAGGSEVLE